MLWVKNKYKFYYENLSPILRIFLCIYYDCICHKWYSFNFRETEFLKSERKKVKTFPEDFDIANLEKTVKNKELKIDKEENGTLYFKNGTYNKHTRTAEYIAKELPLILDIMTQMHKATTKQPLFFLNIS